MRKQNCFPILKPEVTIGDSSGVIGISVHQLSKALKHGLKKTSTNA
jgi:hypothetical protein